MFHPRDFLVPLLVDAKLFEHRLGNRLYGHAEARWLFGEPPGPASPNARDPLPGDPSASLLKPDE